MAAGQTSSLHMTMMMDVGKNESKPSISNNGGVSFRKSTGEAQKRSSILKRSDEDVIAAKKKEILQRDGDVKNDVKSRDVNRGPDTTGDEGFRPPLEAKKWTNCLFAVVFLAFWVGMGVVAVIGFATGDIRRLLFPIDYLGNTCGVCVDGTDSCGMSIYYPRPGFDALLQGFDPFGGSDSLIDIPTIHLFGVCVESCPEPGSYVCKYDIQRQLDNNIPSKNEQKAVLNNCAQQMAENSMGFLNNYGLTSLDATCKTYMDGCWFVTQKQTDFLFRCIGDPVLNSTTEEFCYYPKYQNDDKLPMPGTVCPDQLNSPTLDPTCVDSVCQARTGKRCVLNPRCVHPMEKKTEYSIKDQVVTPGTLIMSQLGTWTATISRSFGDLKFSWWTILVVGVLGAMVVGFAWIFLLKYLVGLFVYLVIFLSLIGLVLCILICFVKAGHLANASVWITNQTNNNTKVVSMFKATSANQTLWYFLGVFLSILTCIYALILLVMRRKIRLAIEILEEASKAVQTIKSVVLLPMISTLFTIILGCYFVGVFGYIFTAGSKKMDVLTVEGIKDGILDQYGTLASSDRRRLVLTDVNGLGDVQDFHEVVAMTRKLIDVNATATLNVGIQTIVQSAGITGMLLYHIFGCLWTFQVIHGMNIITVSHAVSSWYWTKDKSTMNLVPLFSSYRRMLLFHFGSVCLGALLIAIMQFIRLLVYYVVKHTSRLQQNNSIVRIVFRVLQCMLWCFEKLLKYVTGNAYIMVAMFGVSFCEGAKLAIGYIIRNAARIGTVQFIARLIGILSVLVIVTGCTILEYLWLDQDQQFQPGGENEVESYTLTVILTAIASFWIATSFMQVYSIAVDTILLCFCCDCDYNRQSKAYYMSDDLKRFLGKRRRVSSSTKPKPKPSSTTAVVPT